MNQERIEEKKEIKKSMKTIQIAVTDKENLTSKKIMQKKKTNMNSTKLTNSKKVQKTIPINNKTVVDVKNNINKAKSEKTGNDNDSININQVTAQDLTGDVPSENYWQQLAESRRVALESTMKENVDLHNKITELEYENSRLRGMVDEAKNLVEVLTEMLEEKENTTLEENEDTTLEDTTLEANEDEADAPEAADE